MSPDAHDRLDIGRPNQNVPYDEFKRKPSSSNIVNSPQVGSFGHGHHKDDDQNCMGLDLDICPDLLLAGLALAGAGIFLALYTAITMNGRRKKRALGEAMARPWTENVRDLFWLGIIQILLDLAFLSFVASSSDICRVFE